MYCLFDWGVLSRSVVAARRQDPRPQKRGRQPKPASPEIKLLDLAVPTPYEVGDPALHWLYLAFQLASGRNARRVSGDGLNKGRYGFPVKFYQDFVVFCAGRIYPKIHLYRFVNLNIHNDVPWLDAMAKLPPYIHHTKRKLQKQALDIPKCYKGTTRLGTEIAGTDLLGTEEEATGMYGSQDLPTFSLR